ncbi:MAG: GMC family oxidoreductase [Elusimicrobia bacterium]|nr:GMC family oxidoreductase [Elusimicrobiota bacterium]
MRDGAEYDFVVVGSGFGGSVAALRLAEKGYRVAVLETGASFRDEDFPKTNWDLRRFLWLPELFLYGIQRLTLLDDVLVLSGAGVGGGSLVYANTMMEPRPAFYEAPEARRLAPDLKARLAPHFATARRMLGANPVPGTFAADEVLKAIAVESGRGDTFHPVDAAVYFGEPGVETPDPYFGGKGPARAGCRLCGGCMTGCRHNAKNTLVKNYLHLAQALGAEVYARTSVERLTAGADGYALTARRSGWSLGTKTVRARRVVVAAGVLGTLKLLFASRAGLPGLSGRLGRDVRTNSEVLSGVTDLRGATDWSRGTAISAEMRPDDETRVEAVRYAEGCDAMSLLAVRDAGGEGRAARLARLLVRFFARPRESLRFLLPFGWARRSTILLFMSTAESRVRVELRRGRLRSRPEDGAAPPPADLPTAARVLRRFAEKVGGVAQVSSASSLLGLSTTAHVLGGAVMGTGPENGVVGLDGKAFGLKDLWVLDGSVVPGNLGANPSLTITALAEHAMSLVPAAPSARP